jgi:DNA-binding MarR family transcriptional regulator
VLNVVYGRTVAVPSPAESEFVDRMGLVLEGLGAPRTMGRIYGWLLVCEPAEQSLSQLAAALAVSKASVSVVARQMAAAGMVERSPGAGREHRYRLGSGGWAQVLQLQLAGVRLGRSTLESGLSGLGDDRPGVRARLDEARDFFAFAERDTAGLARRWERYRAHGADREA